MRAQCDDHLLNFEGVLTQAAELIDSTHCSVVCESLFEVR
jgi:hypothetical protein